MTLNETIISDFKKGKLESFYQEAYASLLTYAVRILGDEYSFLAEDCVQDTIFKSYQERDKIVSPTQWKTFLFTLVHNQCVSVLRHQQSASNYLSQQGEGLELDYLHSIIEQETLDMLYSAIDMLPQKYRTIFELSFEQGLSNPEIAAQLNLSVSGVKKQKSRMLEIIRSSVSDKSVVMVLMLGL